MTTQAPGTNATTTIEPRPIEPPAEWVHLQQAIAHYLHTPLRLVTSNGHTTFASPPAEAKLQRAIADDGPGSAARLVIYHQQQWQRRLQVLQQTFAKTTAVLGAFSFNRLMLAYLTHATRAERAHDLGEAGAGVYAHLQALLAASSAASSAVVDDDRLLHQLGDVLLAPAPARSALLQALARDEAERRAATAPWLAPVVDGPQRLRAGARRIISSPSLSVLRSTWQWPEAAPHNGRPVQLVRGEVVHHVVARTATGISVVVVDSVTARTLTLAQQHPWPEVVAKVTAAVPEQVRAQVPALLEQTAMRAFAAGWWLGPAVSA
jgi:hypothetical protein